LKEKHVETRKFAKISDPIEVVQFTGGVENGAEIVAWVRENDRGARWEARQAAWTSPDGKNDVPEKTEQIFLRTPRGFKPVLIGHWIAKGDDGNFRSFTDAEIKEGYVAV
jgi:hypothetical protein